MVDAIKRVTLAAMMLIIGAGIALATPVNEIVNTNEENAVDIVDAIPSLVDIHAAFQASLEHADGIRNSWEVYATSRDAANEPFAIAEIRLQADMATIFLGNFDLDNVVVDMSAEDIQTALATEESHPTFFEGSGWNQAIVLTATGGKEEWAEAYIELPGVELGQLVTYTSQDGWETVVRQDHYLDFVDDDEVELPPISVELIQGGEAWDEYVFAVKAGDTLTLSANQEVTLVTAESGATYTASADGNIITLEPTGSEQGGDEFQVWVEGEDSVFFALIFIEDPTPAPAPAPTPAPWISMTNVENAIHYGIEADELRFEAEAGEVPPIVITLDQEIETVWTDGRAPITARADDNVVTIVPLKEMENGEKIEVRIRSDQGREDTIFIDFWENL